MTWNAILGHGHPRMKQALAEAAGRGLLVDADVGVPGQGAGGRAAGRGRRRRAWRRASSVCRAPRPTRTPSRWRGCHRAKEDRRPHPQLPRRHAGHAVAVGRSAARAVRAGPARAWCGWAIPTASAVPSAREPSSCAHECARDLETALLREGPETVAAVILEGMVGANGVFVPPPGYWRACARSAIVTACCSSPTKCCPGFGRTGRWFAVDHDGVTPDLLTLRQGADRRLRPGRGGGGQRPDRPPLRRPRAVVRADHLRAPAGVRGHRRRHRDATRRKARSSARPRWATCMGTALRRLRARPAATSARCGALACCGRWSWRARLATPLHAATMAKLAAALRAAPPAHAQARQPGLPGAAAGDHARPSSRRRSRARSRAGRGASHDGHRRRSEQGLPDRARRRWRELRDGMRIMSGGFGLCGNAEHCIDEIARRGRQGPDHHQQQLRQPGPGAGGAAARSGRCARSICSFIGGNPDLAEQYLAGTVKVELNPQGTFAERIRAGGAGIGGFFTPTGVGTVVAEGKEVREIDGRPYVLETAAARRPRHRARRGGRSRSATCASTAPRATSTR